MPRVNRLVPMQRLPILGGVARQILGIYGIDIPPEVVIGEGLILAHRAVGLVVHPRTTIGRNVTFFPGVTLGRGDASMTSTRESKFGGFVIEDNVILYPGAKVVGGANVITLGEGSVVAPNAVLQESTKPWEIWGGIPAKLIGERTDRSLAWT
jgi:serine O-acetyltransferase